MIRSPISSEERLKNRVEALETRVKEITADFAKLFIMAVATSHGGLETRGIVDKHESDLVRLFIQAVLVRD